jgi:hypothetical protein
MQNNMELLHATLDIVNLQLTYCLTEENVGL